MYYSEDNVLEDVALYEGDCARIGEPDPPSLQSMERKP